MLKGLREAKIIIPASRRIEYFTSLPFFMKVRAIVMIEKIIKRRLENLQPVKP